MQEGKEKDDMQNDQTSKTPENVTEDKGVDKILDELPELLVKHAYTKLKSGEELTASEMKVCLEVCKTYSSDSFKKKPDNILDDVPFDVNE